MLGQRNIKVTDVRAIKSFQPIAVHTYGFQLPEKKNS